MILVDTSVWIDHLHNSDRRLVGLLADDDVGCHPYVIEELSLGSIRDREEILQLLAGLHRFPLLTHEEVMTLVGARRLWGRGLRAVDAHLLGSVTLVGGSRLWTRDKRLLAACKDSDVPCLEEP